MNQLKIFLPFVALQALLTALQWWAAGFNTALALGCLAVSAIVLPAVCGWRLGRNRAPIWLSSVSGAGLTATWIATAYIGHLITGEPDEETWSNVVRIAFWWLITFQVAFAYVGGNRGLKKTTNAA